MAVGKKCAHPICSCTVTQGKYRSTECEAMEKPRTLIASAIILAARAKLLSVLPQEIK
jgi:hypothetical protein